MNTPASTASAVKSTDEGRTIVAEFFRGRVGTHLYDDYIKKELAGDFACKLAQWVVSNPERASTASAITDDQIAGCPFCSAPPRHLEGKAGFWMERVICDPCDFFIERTSEETAIERWNRRAPTAQPVGQDEPAPELCPHCDGTGEQTYMSDGGPDAYEQVGNCEHCGGAQTLAAAYVGVKNMLDRTEKSYREATAIIWHCNAGPTAAGRLENLVKYAKQPELANWLHDRLMALADMARVSPNAAVVEPSQPAYDHTSCSDFLRSFFNANGRAPTTREAYRAAFEAGASTPPAPAAPSPDADLWYLQDTRTYIGNDVTWWAKDGNGYTTDVSKAHAYTREQAFRQAAMRGCDRAWPKAYIDGKTQPAVDFQHINHDAALAASTKGEAS